MIPWRWGPPSSSLADQRLVVGEQFGLEAEPRGQGAEDVVVRPALAPRGDRRRVEHHVVVAVRAVDVEVFELRRGGQDDVGVVDRVGRELLVDDGEQVVAEQALDAPSPVGGNGGRVAVVDVEGPDRRAGQLAARGPRPSWFMLTVRVPGGDRSGRVRRSMAKS